MAGALIPAAALALALAAASPPRREGVEAEVLDELSAILRFVDDSASKGGLVAAGRESPGAGVRAIRVRLEAAWDLVADGALDDACTALESTRRRADGATDPPDLVAGSAVPELHVRVTAASAALGCLDGGAAGRVPTGRRSSRRSPTALARTDPAGHPR